MVLMTNDSLSSIRLNHDNEEVNRIQKLYYLKSKFQRNTREEGSLEISSDNYNVAWDWDVRALFDLPSCGKESLTLQTLTSFPQTSFLVLAL